LKRRAANEQNIASALSQKMESMEHASFRVGQCTLDLQRASAALWNNLSVTDKRLDLRAKRPPQEAVQDAFQDALERERSELLEAHQQVSECIKAGQEARSSVDSAKAEMHQHKLTLHLDRTNWPQEFLAKVRGIEESSAQFCDSAAEVLRKVEHAAKRAEKATSISMKQRIRELVNIRRELETEIHETRCAVAEAERDLDRTQKVIKQHNDAPENRLRSEETDLDFDAINSRVTLEPAAVAKLRATIKGAAYTGHAGRQLDVLFARFDRDGSGHLDEDEVRRALRRTLRIPPSTISDPEISAMCTMLDADDSGSVSITEIVAFLNADVDTMSLEEEYQKKKATLHQLNLGLKEMVVNLRCKVAAWKIDDSCSRVTPVKGLELDSLPVLSKSGDQAPKRKKPLEPRVVERVRSKISKAASAGGGGRSLQELFGRFDKDGSGQLEDEELRRALRGSLKIPGYAISDAEISSLCAMLDSDQSGTISISELVAFVGEEPEDRPPQTARTTLEPINTKELERAPSSSDSDAKSDLDRKSDADGKSPEQPSPSPRPKHGPRGRP